MSAYEEKVGQRISGRELSLRIGKSRNHISQILNDGLVPSGEVLSALGRHLEADDADMNRLLLSAMRTKVIKRARDSYWLREALEMMSHVGHERNNLRRFIESSGEWEPYVAWREEFGEDESPDPIEMSPEEEARARAAVAARSREAAAQDQDET